MPDIYSIGYLDAFDERGQPCQIELDEQSAARERKRALFSMTDSPRAGVALRKRSNYGWTPKKVTEASP